MKIFNRIPAVLTFGLLGVLTSASPAFADIPYGWGFVTSSGASTLAISTWGISALVVILIEAWIFKRFLNLTLARALFISFIMNLVSGFVGYLISGFSFWILREGTLILLVGIPVIFFFLLRRSKPPILFHIVALVTLVFGTFAGFSAAPATYPGIYETPPKPLTLLWAIELPLLMGFGLTLLVEALVVARGFKLENCFKTLMIANVLSYILLIFAFPFFCPSPFVVNEYSVMHTMYLAGRFGIEERADEAVKLLHCRRMTTPQLLGIQEYKPPENYNADFEIRFFKIWAPQGTKNVTLIIDDTLSIPTLTDDAESKLNWFKDYYSYHDLTVEAIEEDNQDKLIQTYSSWVAWIGSNNYPDPDALNDRKWNGIIKDDIDELIENKGSQLISPTGTIEDLTQIESDNIPAVLKPLNVQQYKIFKIFPFSLLASATPVNLDFHEAFIRWGGYAANACVYVSISTYGFFLLLLLFIEAAVFKRAYKLDWMNAFRISAILNTVSILLLFVVGIFPPQVLAFGALIFIIVMIIILDRISSPVYFQIIVHLALLIGAAAIVYTSFEIHVLSQPELIAWLILPILFGLGFSLIIKALLCSSLKLKNFWIPLLLGNLGIFLIAAVLSPFFAQNPYRFSEKEWFTERVRQHLDYWDPQDAVALMDSHRVSLQYLLGISADDGMPDVYNAEFETEFFDHYIIVSYREERVRTEVIEHLLKIPNMSEEASNNLQKVHDKWSEYNKRYEPDYEPIDFSEHIVNE